MSEEEKKELDKKLEGLFGDGDETSQSWRTRGAMCYCPIDPPGRRRKKEAFPDDSLDAIWDNLFTDEKKEDKNSELSSTTEEKQSFWKRLFSKEKK